MGYDSEHGVRLGPWDSRTGAQGRRAVNGCTVAWVAHAAVAVPIWGDRGRPAVPAGPRPPRRGAAGRSDRNPGSLPRLTAARSRKSGTTWPASYGRGRKYRALTKNCPLDAGWRRRSRVFGRTRGSRNQSRRSETPQIACHTAFGQTLRWTSLNEAISMMEIRRGRSPSLVQLVVRLAARFERWLLWCVRGRPAKPSGGES